MDISPVSGPGTVGLTSASPVTAPSGAASIDTTSGQTGVQGLSQSSNSGSPDYNVQLSDLGQYTNALASFQNAVGGLSQSSAAGNTGSSSTAGNPLGNFSNAYNQLQSVYSGLGSSLQNDPSVQGLQNQLSNTVASYAHIEGSYVGMSLGADGTLTVNAVAFNSTMIDTGNGGTSSTLGNLAGQLGSLLQGYSGPGSAGLAGSKATSSAGSSGSSTQDIAQLAAALEQMMASMQDFVQLMFQMLLGGGQSGGLSPADVLAVQSMNTSNSSQNSTSQG